MQVLLAAGASMMVRTVDLDMSSNLNLAAGSTPLHLAAQRGNVGLVQAMLQVRRLHSLLAHLAMSGAVPVQTALCVASVSSLPCGQQSKAALPSQRFSAAHDLASR